MERNEIRKTMLHRLRDFPGKERESRLITEAILASDEWAEAETVLAYCPLPSEPDISSLLGDSRVLLPFIENGAMAFSASRKLQKSPFGFMEPEHIAAEYEKALMLVPMIGRSGPARLGRGGGYYDRYIAENRKRLIVWGLAFSVSECPEFIPEAHDARMDRIISIEA